MDSPHHGILKEALELFHVGGRLPYLLGSSPLIPILSLGGAGDLRDEQMQ